MHTEQPTDSSHIKLARAIQALQQTRLKLAAVEAAQHEPIAIIGMGCHFPGPDGAPADTPQRFWQNLLVGTDSVGELPESRVKDMFGEQRTRLSINAGAGQGNTETAAALAAYALRGGFLRQVDGFDPAFFGLSPREVLVMDPAHRLLLETAWQALEDANLVPIQLFNTEMGVFIGNSSSGYTHFCGEQEDDLYKVTGNVASTAAGRLSYLFGITGPCVSLDTACSSSLVAVHLACQSLRNGECNAALAGGVNIILEAGSSAMFASGNMLSGEARCKTFDAAADGYVRGEGCGVIVLKRLSDAQANGDRIIAVIRGTAVNQDGPSGGLTVPNGPSQERVIRRALADAKLEPAQISYIEAHGTGTPLGDPIEIGALNAVFGGRSDPLYVGSVKTNIGHLEMAAGIAGLMKLALAVQQGAIPPHLHLQTPNPHIDWATSSVRVPTATQPWPQGAGGERIGGVSSFGFSGTNAHVIVAEAPVTPSTTNTVERPAHLLTLSAKSADALVAMAQAYGDFVATHPDLALGDLCYTSHVGRSHFPHRLSIAASSLAELQQRLAGASNSAPTSESGVSYGIAPTSQIGTGQTLPKIAFLFTGQGAQSVDMGRELYATNPTFRATLDRCDALLREQLGESLLAVIYPERVRASVLTPRLDTRQATGDTHHASRITLDDTTYTQPALFALEYALAQLWLSWGIQPDLLIGHSVGELAAACVAGVFSLEDGLKLVAARGRLMGALPQNGAMISLLADEARVQAAIAPYANDVAIAAVNGAESIVISGKETTVLAIADQLTAEGIKSRRLIVSHAFHSPLMEPMLAAFRQVVATITYHPPTLQLISNVTGKLAGAEITTPDYWVRHIRAAVRFADGVATLHAQGINIFLEIGPQPTLLGMVEPILEQMTSGKGHERVLSRGLVLLPSLRPQHSDWAQLLSSLGQLYVQGVAIDWPAVDNGGVDNGGADGARQWRKIGLPTYAFQRQRYWPAAKALGLNDAAPQDGFARWLAANPIEQLTDRITERIAGGQDEHADTRATVAQVLDALAAEQHAQGLAAQVQSLLYEVAWERQPKAALPPTVVTPGRWLILADVQGVGEALAAQLITLGTRVTLVDATADLGEITAALTTALRHETSSLQGILDCGALNATNDLLTADLPASLTQLRHSQEAQLGRLLQLMQTLVGFEPNGHPQSTARLWVITQGAQPLVVTDGIAIAQAPLWGMGRVIALEHGDHWGGLIDVDALAAPLATAQSLLAEILQPDDEEQIAYRAGERYVARLVAMQPPLRADAPTIQRDGVYLVTGGLGGLGLQSAQWLVAQGARQLILTGRHGVQTAAQQTILDALQAQGATIQIAQVDVADAAGMGQLFADLAAAGQPLRGVIHLAGVAGYQALQALTWDEVERVLRPKVLGGWLLHQLTAGLDLDFFISYASGASIWGGKQQAHYGAANHFLDGLMAYRRRQGLPGLSIAWGPWVSVAGEGGMATPAAQATLAAMGVRALSPAQGLAVQAHLLRSTAVQVTAADIDWTKFKALYELTKPRRFLANLVSASPDVLSESAPAPTNALRQELQALPNNQRAEWLQGHLQQRVARILGLATGPEQTTGFAEQGMDSLMALELRRQLEQDFACALPATLAFEYPTVAQLAVYLLTQVLTFATSQPTATLVQTEYRTIGLDEPIAIISMACRFPGAESPEAFWELLQAGADLVQPMPRSRWHVDEFYNPQRATPGKMYMREAALLADVAHFDPLFFGIAPREAEGIDPHHRLLLETGWEALERAGLAQSTLVDSRTGVFVGIGESDFGLAHANGESQGVTGSGHSAAAGRLAYTLGLQGPTMAVDTACSSSLVALHLACQSLRTGECDLALAGGVNLTLSPFAFIALSQMGALAADGRCKSFDAAADGYGRGEGGGLVLLKRLADAQRDGDTILALIKGSAVNHDGPSSGLTVPNKSAQEKVIRQALAAAQVTPAEVSYIEAHGTGTALGDPIEIRALGGVFGRDRATAPLLVGSVKTNIGHLEAAAGIAGLIKTVLALQHGQLPPHLHFQTPSPHIEWGAFAIQIPTTLQPWPAPATGAPLIAGISAFGISGTNAHLVVAAASEDMETRRQGDTRQGDTRQEDRGTVERPRYLLPLSAKSGGALGALAERYLDQLRADPAIDLGDLCYTAVQGRNHFPHRLAIVGADLADLQAQLVKVQAGAEAATIVRGIATQPRPRLAFLFTGQGSQYVQMGRELYVTEPTFRATIDHCDALLREHLGESLLEVMYPEAGDTHHELRITHSAGTGELRTGQTQGNDDKSPAAGQSVTRNAELVNQTTYTQPALFVLEYALATLWQAWGVQPDLLIGHSVGELVAACVAGVFSLEDGLKLVAARGRLIGALPQDGAMVALNAGEIQVQAALTPYHNEVSIAAVNGPESVVIAGTREKVLEIAERLAATGVKTRQLTVSHAFHSGLMEPMLAAFRQVAESITYHVPTVGLVANLTGQLAGAEVLSADYWVRHVREAVRFADGIATLYEQGIDIFLEIGPKPTLLAMVEPVISAQQSAERHPVTRSPGHPVTLPSLRENHSDWQQLLISLGTLYVHGVKIDWAGFDQAYQRRKVQLPTYPFQRQLCWPAPTQGVSGTDGSAGFANWLATSNVEQLTDRLTARMGDARMSDGRTVDGADRAQVTKLLNALAAERQAQQQTAQLEALLYEVIWEPQRRAPSTGRELRPPATVGGWLILADQGGVAQAVATQLQQLGEMVTLVPAAADLTTVTQQLTTALDATLPLRGVLHLWALDPLTVAPLTIETGTSETGTSETGTSEAAVTDLMHYQERNLDSLLQLVQTLAGRASGARLWVATQGAQQLAATEAVAAAQSPLWGMGRVIALEHGELWGGLIDLAVTDALATQAQNLLAELLQPTPDFEEQVAYRRSERYVARLVPARPAITGAAPVIHPDGSYLITGGLGSLGLQSAQWLVNAGARQLILTGRHGVQHKKQQTILDELAAAGATVKVALVDVADGAAMRKLFAELSASPYPLRGVLHEAGVVGYKALRSLQWADFVNVLAPKVVGGWLLHQLTAGLDLDFFISYSSGASIWGGKQQAHYGAANHFLDGLMAYRRSQGLPGLSIAWGPWGGGGMASPEAQALLGAMGVRALAPAQGLAIQAYLLQTTASQITAADIDWSQLKTLYELTKPRRFLAHLATASQAAIEPAATTSAAVIQELLALPTSQRPGHLRRYLRTVVGQVLGLGDAADEVFNTTSGFTDLGMDSLMALEVRRQLERGLQQPLPTTVALEYPTIDALAAYLLDLLRPQLGTVEATDGATQRAPSTGRALDPTEPIAVISMACRFPGADTPEAFWQLLHDGVDLVQPVPAARWDVDAYYDPQRPMPGKMYTREAAFIQGVEEFDPLFFGIAPREAAGMDPQHRLILEVGWEVLERAGIAPITLVDSPTGVFIGIGAGDYGALTGVQSLTELDTHTATSSGHSIAAGRLSYALGLQGPAMAVDTACSSSLVALHLACQSLRNGECDLALAGGVKLMLSPLAHIALAQLQAIAPDGRCKTFDAAADGYGRGEGSGMVALKRLSDAERDGDPILAVIKGSAVNHNGPSSGLTVPNKRAQEKLLRQALAAAGVTPAAVGYIEAHGTGTSLGDPIEIRALGAVFGAERATPLLVGSVKTNVAHLEEAAGIAGFIKTVLALQHGQIPPHLHFTTPNPYIEWDEVAIRVPTTLQPWPTVGENIGAENGERVAGVSSFGLSGTNAHLVVAAASQRDKKTGRQGHERVGSPLGATRDDKMTPAARPLHLLTLSAKSGVALTQLAARYHDHLQTQPTIDLGDLCYTAAVGRSPFNQRLAIVAADGAELADKLGAVAQGQLPDGVLRGTVTQEQAPIAFLFTGQGAQYLGMGRGLYETQPVFRSVIERCDVVAQAVLGRSLIELLYPATPPDHNDLIDSHPCGQAVNFALECALVELWQSWGIQPDLVLGHSLGDFAAAYAAGVLSLEDGLRLVSIRGRLMEQAVGSMVSVMGAEAEVAPFVAPYADVVIGVINGPRSVVISGGHAHVAAATAVLDAAGFKTRKVAVPMAAHSPLLDPVLDEFETFIREQITLHPPQRPVVSSMTGKLVTTELTDPGYWRQHLRQPVRFVDGIETLTAVGCTIFIEIGPKPTLLGMVEPILEQMTGGEGHERVGSPLGATRGPLLLPSLRQQEDDWRQMLTDLGALAVRGVRIDWVGFDQPYARRKVLLPTYPFQRERYWLEPPKRNTHAAALRPLIHRVTQSPLHQELIFESEFSVETLPFLADHRVYDTVVSPGACQLAMVLSAAELIFNQPSALGIEDVVLPQALVLPQTPTGGGARTVQAVFATTGANGNADHYDFQLISFGAGAQGEAVDLAKHATGYVTPLSAVQNATVDLATLRQQCDQRVDVAAFYAVSAQAQIVLGPSFCWLAELWQGQSEGHAAALAKLTLPETAPTMTGNLLHPGLLDGCFQTANSACDPQAADGLGEGETLLPFALRALRFYQPVHGKGQHQVWWCHAIQVARHKWDIQLLDESGALLVAMEGFEMRAAAPDAIRQADDWRDWLYDVTWQPQPYFGLAPDYLPLPATLVSVLRTTLAGVSDDSQPFQSGLDALSIDYVLAAFARAGFTFRVGSQWRIEQIIQQISVIPSYRRLLQRLLAMLTEAGILRDEERAAGSDVGGLWTVLHTPAIADPAARLALLQRDFGERPALALFARCGEKLGEVLRGLQDPHALLASTPAPTTVLDLLLPQVIQQVVAALPPACGLRIVELGSELAQVTEALLPLLPPARIDYLFTAADPAVLTQAQKGFADQPLLRYQLFDPGQSPAEQGVVPASADLVIAANVLHGTADVAQALRHARALLQPGGQLLLLEATTPTRFLELTQGLSARWWRFADDRQAQPLLTAAQWRSQLLANGFQMVEQIDVAGHALLIAQAAVAELRPEPVEGSAVAELVPAGREAWLIFADQQGVGEALAAQLQENGAAATLVYAGHAYQQVGPARIHLRPDQAEDYLRLVGDHPGYRVIHLWSLDTLGDLSSVDLLALAEQSCGTVLQLLQALLQSAAEPAGLWLVTQDAQAVTRQDEVRGVAQAALWGMGKVIALEHPELHCVRIDLDRRGTAVGHAAQLYTEIRATKRVAAPAQQVEEQVALRADGRYVARLRQYVAPPALPVPDQPYRLELSEAGTLDNLHLCPAVRRVPQAGEVEIAVQASGMNFRDLFVVLGLWPGEPGLIGTECAGVIVAIGADVTDFAIGDEVIVMVPGSFSQYVTAYHTYVIRKPATVNACEAAALPSVFSTAYYGLQEIAQMKAGDRVLIHAAAGGVGMAALQLAQLVGAEIFATASPSKWAALRAQGITHLYHSRTVDFAGQILADTGGKGVDIILNSLTGPGFIEANLAALAPSGYLVEMSKRDIWHPDQIAALRPDVRYRIIDLMTIGNEDPELVRTMLARIVALYADKQLKPLPYTAFPVDQAIAAFRYMQQAKHIGKIVLTPVTVQQPLQAQATYLITGGLGGIGLAVAHWLATQGAGQIMLLGRSKPSAELQPQLDAIMALGAKLTIVQADVTIFAQLQAALQQIDPAYPLRGVIHAVGVLDDAILANQSWTRFERVLAPKLQGAWHLHALTAALPLDFFVLFSSTAGLLGNRGQANHAAANAFLDAFVHYRRARGLPALSINWGAWAEVGAAAALVRTQQQQLLAQGMGVINVRFGLDAFAYLLQQRVPQIGVVPIHWAKFFNSGLHTSLFYADFVSSAAKQAPTQATSEQPSAINLRGQLAAAAGQQAERDQLLQRYLRTAVAQVLGLRNPEQIDPREGLLDLGLDSLMAVELRNQIGRALEMRLPSTLIFDYPTIAALQQYLLDALFSAEETAQPASTNQQPVPVGPEIPASAEIDDANSTDEIAELLAQLVYAEKS